MERARELGAAVVGLELGAASAPQVGEHSAADQDPGDLRVTADPPRALAQPSDQVQRSRHRPTRYQRLEDDQYEHPEQQRDRHPEDHEPHGR